MTGDYVTFGRRTHSEHRWSRDDAIDVIRGTLQLLSLPFAIASRIRPLGVTLSGKHGIPSLPSMSGHFRVWSYAIGQDAAKPPQRAFAFNRLLEIYPLLFEEPDGV